MQPIIQHNEQYTRLHRRINELVRKPRNRFEEMEMVQIDCLLTVADMRGKGPIQPLTTDYEAQKEWGEYGGREG